VVVDALGYLDDLNPAQRSAVEFGVGGSAAGPLLVIAGAGSGKTKTLAHRVAHLIVTGADPQRILLLTFTRRAAAEMTRRAQAICARSLKGAAASDMIPWSGTFHAVANRLLRLHAAAIGLDPAFTVLDRSDAEDLMNMVRDDLGLSRKTTRFPRKGTCFAIYSHVINTQRTIDETLESAFPWCREWGDDLRLLFAAYAEAKQKQNVADYDDLLLYWFHMMAEPAVAATVRPRFDHVLVDEYQDTNALQASILLGLKPDGAGLTIVGDDAQSIYSFRGATVRNILDFPNGFDPPATIVTLEQNYRSREPILAACNAVIGLARERFTKNLFSTRRSQQKPLLITAEDERAQVDYVVTRILAHREDGIALKRQAVLFRASSHSALLELELTRRNIPFVKYGGLKFLEAAHVKDLIAVLRWAENPRDEVAAFRVLQLLPGIGPGHARRATAHLASSGFDLALLETYRPPPTAAEDFPALCALLTRLRGAATPWQGQVAAIGLWYQPHLERIYDEARARAGDLEQLEQIAAGHASRERFLSELTLDSPDATGANAGPPLLDEDYLILSTIHSAKGQEWDSVFVINAADGCIPSDMGIGTPDQVEEERRLLYVAMTRARDHLHIVHPLSFYRRQQHRHGDGHVYAQLTRFIPPAILDRFERHSHGRQLSEECRATLAVARINVAAKARAMWR
jgi:DNA helicase-2/ATP-dependent DNA helicase PcrA